MADDADLRMAFDSVDLHKEGHIPVLQIQYALQTVGIDCKDEDLIYEILDSERNIAKKGEKREDDCIDFKQFKHVYKEAYKLDLKKAFHTIAPKGADFIYPDTLKGVLKPILGVDITEKELEIIIAKADSDGDGKIDIEEFVEFMVNIDDMY